METPNIDGLLQCISEGANHTRLGDAPVTVLGTEDEEYLARFLRAIRAGSEAVIIWREGESAKYMIRAKSSSRVRRIMLDVMKAIDDDD